MPEMKYLTENVFKAVLMIFDQLKFQGFEYVPFKSETRDQMIELAEKAKSFTKEKINAMEISDAKKSEALDKICGKLIEVFGKHIKQDVPAIFKEYFVQAEVNKSAGGPPVSGATGSDENPDWRFVLGPELVAKLTKK